MTADTKECPFCAVTNTSEATTCENCGKSLVSEFVQPDVNIDQTGQYVAGNQVNIGEMKGDIGHVGDVITVEENARMEINRFGDYIVQVDSLEKLENEPPKPGEPPYKGLTYFTEKDAHIFFGREQLSDDLAARLETSQFLAVVGASGSGKSSLLRAGVVPRLRRKNWQIHIITPTANPLGQLANSLTKDDEALDAADEMREQLLAEPQTLRRAAEKMTARGNAARFLLIIDQFEELFTLCNDGEAQRAYLDNLLAAAASMGGVHILIGLRADFTGHLTEPKELKELVEENIVLLGRMEQEELVWVIMEPAKVGGWAFVDGLVEQILKDVGREPGRLPLLSHALLETWERRSAHVMTLKGYREAGGVDGAIAKTAEDTLRQLGDEDKQAIMQAIFLELTELGEGAEDTRRIAQRDDLVRTGDEADVSAVLEALVKARLVTVDGDSVEVAHEALIRRWPQLREWLAENRERLRFERQLERDAVQWEELERDDGPLYRGAQLARAAEFVERDELRLAVLPAEFLAASRELAAREEREREAQRQRDLEQAQKLAEEQRLRAEEGEKAASGLRKRLILATIAAAIALIALGAAVFLGMESQSNANIAATAAIEADTQRDAALAASTAEAQQREAAEANEAIAQEQSDIAATAVVEADEQRDAALAASTAEAQQRATADASAAEALRQEKIAIERGETGRRALARDLAKGSADAIGEGNHDLALLLAEEAVNSTLAEDSYVHENAFEAMVASIKEAPPWLMNLPRQRHNGPVSSAAYSPDGASIVTASDDDTAKVWEAASGAELLTLSGHEGGVDSAAYSPDGASIVTASDDGTAKVWEAASGAELLTLSGHERMGHLSGVQPGRGVDRHGELRTARRRCGRRRAARNC